jgi:hypothetical protein
MQPHLPAQLAATMVMPTAGPAGLKSSALSARDDAQRQYQQGGEKGWGL